MKRVNAIVTDSTEKALIDWAHGLHPKSPRPKLDEAATLALEEFALERRDLLERLADARARAEKHRG